MRAMCRRIRTRAVFAQALRAIGEPIMDRPAHEISMARLLTQLFEVTGQFDMATQPQLLLLQKTMVVVEGVARMLNPHFNMWVRRSRWCANGSRRSSVRLGQIEGAAEGAACARPAVHHLPEMLAEAQAATHMLADMANAGGIRLDRETTEALGRRPGPAFARGPLCARGGGGRLDCHRVEPDLLNRVEPSLP